MAIIDIVMPKMGESIMEATILKWCKSVGDNVKMDETLLEIATDKVDSEVPSTGEGVLKEILFKVDDIVPVGTVIAKIDTASGAVAASPAPAAAPAPTPAPAPQAAAPAAAPAANTGSKANANFFSPLVLNIAAQENVSMAELQNINGTGAEGRITKKDILNYVANRGS